jgi:hypothetical protein
VVGDGCRVEICLFGSIENCAGYLSASKDSDPPIWRSSSTWAIEEFIENRGLRPAPAYDDDQSIAVEILRTLNSEGMTGRHVDQRLDSSEWFAQVPKDVELDKERWNFRPGTGSEILKPVDRIVIGMPLWFRSNQS